MRVPSGEETATTSLHDQSFSVDRLKWKALIKTARGAEGGRTAETEDVTTAWDAEAQKLTHFFFSLSLITQ